MLFLRVQQEEIESHQVPLLLSTVRRNEVSRKKTLLAHDRAKAGSKEILSDQGCTHR